MQPAKPDIDQLCSICDMSAVPTRDMHQFEGCSKRQHRRVGMMTYYRLGERQTLYVAINSLGIVLKQDIRIVKMSSFDAL